jgi:hypothetical protein
VAIVRSKERDGYEAVQIKMGRTKKEFKDAGGETMNRGISCRSPSSRKGTGFGLPAP